MSLGNTADGKPIVDGLIVFTNDMKVGKVLAGTERHGWFDVEHLDGTKSMMNGERVSTTFRTYDGRIEYATEAYTKAQKGDRCS